MAFSTALRTQIVLTFLLVQKRYGAFCNKWTADHPGWAIPSRSAIYKILKKFSLRGNVSDSPRSGRRKSVRNPATIAAIRDAFHRLAHENEDGEDGNVGVRAVARELNISHTSVWRVARMDLKWRGYKPRLVQALKVEDYQRRVLFCNQLLTRINEEPDFINRIIWSDESTFTCRGHVST